MEIGAHDYGGIGMPQSATICKLEKQESQGCNSVPVQRPKNQELQCLRPGGDGYPC